MSRLPTGGRIRRDQPLRFVFDGQALTGFAGDTLASALIANGRWLAGRSIKYHRPRGIVGSAHEETNVLVQRLGEDGEPNLRATTTALVDGLTVRSVNTWPSARHDLGACTGLLAPLLPAGFYYKTFLARRWDTYSRFIRRMAGLGQVPASLVEARYEHVHQHVDVLVVGGGAAGLVAAERASRGRARVMLVDDADRPGGTLPDSGITIDGENAGPWLDSITAILDARDNVTRLANTVATGLYDHHMVVAVEQQPAEPWVRERLWHLRARRIILATGAVERPLVFANNDLPGIVLASAARTLVERYAVAPGQRAVFFTNNTSAYAAAVRLADAGIEVVAIVDSRADPGDEARLAERRGIEVLAAHHVCQARGRRRLKGIVVQPAGGGATRRLRCDLLCLSGGWNPLLHLHSHAGPRPRYDDTLATFLPGAALPGVDPAGAVAGHFHLAEALADGVRAGADAVAEDNGRRAFTVDGELPYAIVPLWQVPGGRGKAFVDFHNDVTVGDIALAQREGMQSIEHVKRYTTAGMATDQGKMSNANVVGLVAALTGASPGETGTTTYRPPYRPVSLGVVGGADRGELVLPWRTTPITPWHIAHGAVMGEAGNRFRRPMCYPAPGEDPAQAIRREALAARRQAAIYDGTPLGKFLLSGADAATFLERVCTNRWRDLPVGRGRYALMLREDGRLFDDGVALRLAEHEYLLFCGTAAAPAVHTHLERLLQVEWPELDVFITEVSSQLASLCVCGPRAREVLGDAGTDLDLSTGFRFLAWRDGHVGGMATRVARIGYTGELSFELHVRRKHALALWQVLVDAGARHGLTPIGSDTSAVLRIEKGFVAAATEGDNCVNADDAGLGFAVDMSKHDFIGRRSLERDRRLGGRREQVVGLLLEDDTAIDPIIDEGSAILREHGHVPGFEGHVTAACFSPTLARPIALALLEDGRARHGEHVTLSNPRGMRQRARVTPPVFVDPEGGAMRS